MAGEDKIIHNAENKNKLDRGSTSSMKQAVTAEANLQDVAALIASMRKNSEPLIHCAVFIELSARDPDSLRALRDEVTSELIRSKLGADRLLLRQREGFLLGLHSMCRGAESKFFNGHTNITTSRFLVFGVKGLLQASRNVKNALLFNVLSYLSDKLLTEGSTAAGLDELYIWLSNLTAIKYIRNSLKRVRKKESSMILASQNLEDFDVDGVRELTRPLFAIPTHQFLFNAGSVDKKFYVDNLQLEPAEFELIRYPQRGVCLYRCGNERYLLEVHAPPYKEKLFGTAGGR